MWSLRVTPVNASSRRSDRTRPPRLHPRVEVAAAAELPQASRRRRQVEFDQMHHIHLQVVVELERVADLRKRDEIDRVGRIRAAD